MRKDVGQRQGKALGHLTELDERDFAQKKYPLKM